MSDEPAWRPHDISIYGEAARQEMISHTTLSFLSLFFLEKGKETTRKTRIFYRYRTPKILEKEGKNAQKNRLFLAGKKNKEFPKNKERKDRVWC